MVGILAWLLKSLFGPSASQIDEGLHGKVAVITGASQGLGSELAKQLLSHGCNVVISSRNAERLSKRAGIITDELNAERDANSANKCGKVYTVVADVSISADCVRLVKETIKRFGKLDYMVNNCGVNFDAEVIEMDETCTALKMLMEINVMGPAMCTRAALPELIKTKGQVVAISSLAGHVGVPTGSGYSASKFALEGFFSAIRPELAHKGVGVLVVEPGGMDHGDTSVRAVVNANGVLGVPMPGGRYCAAAAVSEDNPGVDVQTKSKKKGTRRKPTSSITERIVRAMALRNQSELYSLGIFTMFFMHVMTVLWPRRSENAALKFRNVKLLPTDFKCKTA